MIWCILDNLSWCICYRSSPRGTTDEMGVAGDTGESLGGARQHHRAALDVRCGVTRGGFRGETEWTWRIWQLLGFGSASHGRLVWKRKAFYPFSVMPWTSLNFYTGSIRCLIFFPHPCDWSPRIHSHGSDFVFWTLLFRWFGTCICSSRLLARFINRYVGPMHFILPSWIYIYYLLLLLILGKIFLQRVVIFGDMGNVWICCHFSSMLSVL